MASELSSFVKRSVMVDACIECSSHQKSCIRTGYLNMRTGVSLRQNEFDDIALDPTDCVSDNHDSKIIRLFSCLTGPRVSAPLRETDFQLS